MTALIGPVPDHYRTGGITTLGVTPSQGDKSLRTNNAGQSYMAETNKNEIRAFRKQVGELVRARYPLVSRLEPIFPKGDPVALRVELRMPLLKAQTENWRGGQPIIWHAVAKDADKQLRAIGDAFTEAHVWADDGQLCWVQVLKVRHPAVGAVIEWRAL